MDQPEPPPHDQLPVLAGYVATVTPLRGRSTRVDVHVADKLAEPDAFTDTNIVSHLRRFFDQLEAEADRRKDDPVAMTNALLRMEALLADVRYVRDTIRTHTANTLNAHNIRKLSVEHIGAVEGTSESDTTWDHKKAMWRVVMAELDAQAQFDDPRWVEVETGQLLNSHQLADAILECAAVAYWRKGALRDRDINPNDVSDTPVDEDDKTLRTPAVRIHDNRLRRNQ